MTISCQFSGAPSTVFIRIRIRIRSTVLPRRSTHNCLMYIEIPIRLETIKHRMAAQVQHIPRSNAQDKQENFQSD